MKKVGGATWQVVLGEKQLDKSGKAWPFILDQWNNTHKYWDVTPISNEQAALIIITHGLDVSKWK